MRKDSLTKIMHETLETKLVGHGALTLVALLLVCSVGCRRSAIREGTYLVGEKYFRDLNPPPDITRRDMALELREGRFSMWGMKGNFVIQGQRLILKPSSKDDKARMIMYDKLRLPREGESGDLSLSIEDPKTLAWERPANKGEPSRYVIFRWQGD